MPQNNAYWMVVGKSETGLAKIWVNLNLSDGILGTIPFFLTSEFLYKLNVLTLNYMLKQYFLEFYFILKTHVRKTAVKIKLDPP